MNAPFEIDVIILHAVPAAFLFLWYVLSWSARDRHQLIFDCVLFCLLARIIGEFHFRPVSSIASSVLANLAVGILLAKGVSAFFSNSKTLSRGPSVFVLRGILCLAAVTSFYRGGPSATAFFKGIPRESGPWDDPNAYGVFMAIALIIGIGLITECFSRRNSSVRARLELLSIAIACLAVGRACLASYSRGAYLAAFAGMTFIAFFCLKSQLPIWGKLISHKSIRLLSITIAFGVIALALSVFGGSLSLENLQNLHPIISRVATVLNSSDLSWLNRVHAWIGGSKIIADNPWSGVGIDGYIAAYSELYKPDTVSSEIAIETNDLIVLGCSMGIPFLLAIAALVWISLVRINGRSTPTTVSPSENIVSISWNAVLLATLCAQWFNGILTSWSLGWIFWVSLGAGVHKHCWFNINGRRSSGRRLIASFPGPLIIAAFLAGSLLLAAHRISGAPDYDAFYGDSRLFVLRAAPTGRVDGVAFVFEPKTAHKNAAGYGGLRQMAEMGFVSFGLFHTENITIGSADWATEVEKCRNFLATRNIPSLYVFFGAGSSDYVAEALRLCSAREINVCWLGVDWLSKEGQDSMNRVIRILDGDLQFKNRPSGLTRYLTLFTLPKKVKDRDFPEALTEQFHSLNIFLSSRPSAGALETRLRPLGMRESAQCARKNLKLGEVFLPPREAHISVEVAIFSTALFLITIAFVFLVFTIINSPSIRKIDKLLLVASTILAALELAVLCSRIIGTRSLALHPRVPNKSIFYTRYNAICDYTYYQQLLRYQSLRINPKISDRIYDDFVISSPFASMDDSELRLRMDYFKALRSRLAMAKDAVSTALVVRSYILNNMMLVEDWKCEGETLLSWQQRTIALSQSPALYLAALRSVGVPSRSINDTVEIWSSGEWRPAPALANIR